MRAPPPLPDPLSAERLDLDRRAGRIALWRAGRGAPVLLVHSINAAASAREIRPAFEAIVPTRRAFAPDLPGFGASDRSDRRYDVALYVAAIDDALDAIGEECGDVPVDVLALSLSAEFAARAAVRRPGRVRTLTLVTPTGLDRRSASLRAPPQQTRPRAALLQRRSPRPAAAAALASSPPPAPGSTSMCTTWWNGTGG